MKSAERRRLIGFTEIKEALTPAGRRLEYWRNTIGLFLGPVLAVAIFLLPLPSLSAEAHRLAGIITWVVVWWITEPVPIPITALLGSLFCVLFGVTGAKAAFAAFADPIIYLFLGSFILAEAMAAHGLDKRFAYRLMSLPWVGDSAGRILFVFGAIVAFLSMWISNTATAAMMLPIGLGIITAMTEMGARRMKIPPGPRTMRFATGMMLMTAYAASAGGIGTPVGTPPNLIGLALIEKYTGTRIAFFQWMLLAVPLLLAMYVLLFGLLYGLHRPEAARMQGAQDYIRKEMKRIGGWTRGQKNVLAAFGLAVALWITPGFLALFFGSSSPPSKFYTARMPEAVAALIAASLLFVLPVNWKERRFTLTWRQALKIDWGTLLLFGGGITLGELMLKTKLAEAVGHGILHVSGASSLWGITLAAIVAAVIISETTSNTASATMVVPVMISLALAAKVNPLPPALGATLGSSWGFILPVSTPPNAIVYGSGLVPITKMIRAGLLFDLAGTLLIWLGLRLLLPLSGLM